MNPLLQTLFDFIQQSETLSSEEKKSLFNSLKAADKELEIVAFKLDRTEKVKRTTAILLEETIEELELKRKAVEAQNRELEIESALERVRTVAMGMSKPDDMISVCRMISDQLEILKVEQIRNVQTAIINEVKGTYLNYQYFTAYKKSIIEDTNYHNHPTVFDMVQAIKKSADAYFTGHFKGTELDNFREWRKQEKQLPDPLLDESLAMHYYFLSIGQGGLGLTTYSEISEEDLNIFKRFHIVFVLAYRRFIDIELAEAQVKEAQIEAALEKVRSMSMAMQKSDELKEVIQIVYDQLVLLKIPVEHTGFILDYKNRDDYYSWIADHLGSPSNITIPYFDTLYYNRFNEAKKKELDFFTVNLSRKEKNKFYRDLFIHLPGFQETSKEFILKKPALTISTVLLDHVALYIENFSGNPYTDEENEVLMRFGKVFQQTYTRFLDLQKAEAQAKEAEIQLALERVRARSLAMHHTSELQEVVNIAAQQLLSIGMDINGGVFICINNETESELSIWASGGMADYVQKVVVPVLNKPIFTTLRDAIKKGNNFLTEAFSDKEKQELFTHLFNYDPWRSLSQDRKQELLARKGGFARSVVISHYTSISITNHNGKSFTDEENEILKRFGKVFEQSYIRFLDLHKAEAQAKQAEQDLIAIKEAKQKAEEALTELKATQAQLIQSEKMASLGELTAGIAHEIQNPLNFVNNFSEVSKELIGEMNDELAAGNWQSAKEISEDIGRNLEKINHHGKRADAIVKGMLQHSRTSSGQKEPTDINALADEYLRLAYHGLRAKDKSFNATLKTDFDESIGKINIIQQDIGRAILNLITNSFYAVSEKKKLNIEDYEPVVSVTSKKINKRVEIIVADNGMGIPQKILDKIFQPFFTTKPAGQGTGLGLSLSYDIVKAHNGEIQVASDDKGTVFTIKLPNQND